MKKITIVFLSIILCIPYCYAVVRDTETPAPARTTLQQRVPAPITTPNRVKTARTPTVVAARTSTNARTLDLGTNTTSRGAIQPRGAAITTPSKNQSASRVAITKSAPVRTARAGAVAVSAGATTASFGAGYNTCRDAYFTCMDQFCAVSDGTYRRCICSSRLTQIKASERAIGQTVQQLDDFKSLNIDVITKTGAEVKSMLTATAGEKASKVDKSDSAQKLAGISSVLNKTKTNSLSTAGKLDIAGDINSIWSTTDLAGGANIANLSGESLYDAVHAQCGEFARSSCENNSTLNMVISAYGMQIENDCTILANALSKKTNDAGVAIRDTEREMNLARLENYDAHNSTSINDCIAQVRSDITTEVACGPGFIHCLDITGKYLTKDTGEPIYSSDFYQLETQTSLSGDTLSNQVNRMLIIELNRKKEFAKRGLDTCRDLSGDVWSEFMRQAISEIYQGQQSRVRDVKNDCINIVNNCYDTQSKSLKDFSNIKEQLLLGARLELSEQMCREKLDACANLYGGGDTGLAELLTTMKSITDQKIAKSCKQTLEEYTREICITPSSDIIHTYPFGCRVYSPGLQMYASDKTCNDSFSNNKTETGGTGGTGGGTSITNGYNCPAIMQYNRCNPGYYMAFGGQYNPTIQIGNTCLTCPVGSTCAGGTAGPDKNQSAGTPSTCGNGDDYIGSLYQKLVRYALQTCVRPSESDSEIPAAILADVNVVMDKIKIDMGTELAKECERLGGAWMNTPWTELKDYEQLESFYTETSSNIKWGSCVEKK